VFPPAQERDMYEKRIEDWLIIIGTLALIAFLGNVYV
jgi:hypothetical protein